MINSTSFNNYTRNIRLNLLLLAIIITVSSCGISKNLSNVSTNIKIASDKKSVIYDGDGEGIIFPLSSLWSFYDNTTFPIITSENGNYSNWLNSTQGDTLYRSLLSENSYNYWQKTVKSILKKHTQSFDELLFTVPGRLIVYTEKHRDIEKIKPIPNFAVVDFSSTYRYRPIDFEYTPSLMREYYTWYIFRSIINDSSKKIVIAVDRIYLEESKKILCLMYICTGKMDYPFTLQGTTYYKGDVKWQRYNPIKNPSMASEFFYLNCDPISIQVIKYLFKYKPRTI